MTNYVALIQIAITILGIILIILGSLKNKKILILIGVIFIVTIFLPPMFHGAIDGFRDGLLDSRK